MLLPALAQTFAGVTETLLYLVSISRGFPCHEERMTAIAFDTALWFIRTGKDTALEVLQLLLREGASLAPVPPAEVDPAKQHVCRNAEEQGNWIDLIAHLTRWGYSADAGILKRLKPGAKPVRLNRKKLAGTEPPEQPKGRFI